jgi:enoyl-CoA hydratase/carnithine racemase
MAVVTTERDGEVLTIRLNRPEKLNAMNFELLDGVLAALSAAAAEPLVRVVILTGAGRAFCSGGDLTSTLQDRQEAVASTVSMAMKSVEVYSLMEWLPKPIIAMVNGLAYAGGLGFLLYSDLSLSVDSARFCCPMAARGLYEPYIATRLANRVGVERAKYILLTAREFTAAEALVWGMVSEVHPGENLEAATHELAGRLASHDAKSLRDYKHTLRRMLPDLDLGSFLNEVVDPQHEGVMERFAKEFPDRRSSD